LSAFLLLFACVSTFLSPSNSQKAQQAGLTLTIFSDAPFDPSVLVKNKETGEMMISRMYHQSETPESDGKCYPQSR
jgi:hypothetical protein